MYTCLYLTSGIFTLSLHFSLLISLSFFGFYFSVIVWVKNTPFYNNKPRVTMQTSHNSENKSRAPCVRPYIVSFRCCGPSFEPHWTMLHVKKDTKVVLCALKCVGCTSRRVGHTTMSLHNFGTSPKLKKQCFITLLRV